VYPRSYISVPRPGPPPSTWCPLRTPGPGRHHIRREHKNFDEAPRSSSGWTKTVPTCGIIVRSTLTGRSLVPDFEQIRLIDVEQRGRSGRNIASPMLHGFLSTVTARAGGVRQRVHPVPAVASACWGCRQRAHGKRRALPATRARRLVLSRGRRRPGPGPSAALGQTDRAKQASIYCPPSPRNLLTPGPEPDSPRFPCRRPHRQAGNDSGTAGECTWRWRTLGHRAGRRNEHHRLSRRLHGPPWQPPPLRACRTSAALSPHRLAAGAGHDRPSGRR